MREIADQVPQPFLRWVALYQAGMMAQLHGRLDEADALIEDAVARRHGRGPARRGALLRRPALLAAATTRGGSTR